MLETNKHPQGVCNIGWGKGGRITDEKGVFIQTQIIIVSLKALVSVKCLDTFVHDRGNPSGKVSNKKYWKSYTCLTL